MFQLLPAQGLPVPSLLAGLCSKPQMEARNQETQEALHENHSEKHCREEGEAGEGSREQLHSCCLSCPLKLLLCRFF